MDLAPGAERNACRRGSYSAAVRSVAVSVDVQVAIETVLAEGGLADEGGRGGMAKDWSRGAVADVLHEAACDAAAYVVPDLPDRAYCLGDRRRGHPVGSSEALPNENLEECQNNHWVRQHSVDRRMVLVVLATRCANRETERWDLRHSPHQWTAHSRGMEVSEPTELLRRSSSAAQGTDHASLRRNREVSLEVLATAHQATYCPDLVACFPPHLVHSQKEPGHLPSGPFPCPSLAMPYFLVPGILACLR